MKSILYAAAVASLASVTSAAFAKEPPPQTPSAKMVTVQGCFGSLGSLKYNSSQEWQSRDKCGHDFCAVAGYEVAATAEGTKCYCGHTYPARADLADDKMCNVSCTGFGESCGGIGFYTVYNTGINLDVTSDEDSAKPSSTSTGGTTAATTVIGGQTVFVTQDASTGDAQPSSKPNVAGIAAGVVVGVVVVAAAVGGLFFYMRRKRNQEIEEEHRRSAAVNQFIHGGKPGSSAGSMSDSRMDPALSQRRMSDGSIADNQDYSRKILRVTNA